MHGGCTRATMTTASSTMLRGDAKKFSNKSLNTPAPTLFRSLCTHCYNVVAVPGSSLSSLLSRNNMAGATIFAESRTRPALVYPRPTSAQRPPLSAGCFLSYTDGPSNRDQPRISSGFRPPHLCTISPPLFSSLFLKQPPFSYFLRVAASRPTFRITC